MSPHAAPSRVPNQRRRWDIFCRVIDNFGDVGVCWRLAAELAGRGQQVRLVCDDSSALAWMAPQGHPGVQVVHWPADAHQPAPPDVADVVIEALGCNPPAGYVHAMQALQEGREQGRAERSEGHGTKRLQPPVWINLEHLSAEGYVERSHGLPSPQPGGLLKWFFFPGFTPRTGGLSRETDLAARRAAFQREIWLAGHGIAPHPGERLVSLFCYESEQLPQLVQALATQPTLLLLTPGPARAAAGMAVTGLRVQALPWLTQPAYDELLWACDLNFVRGEDSLVRALWAGKPWVWQAYRQHDHAHHAKVTALLELMQPDHAVAALWRWWNGMPGPLAAQPLAPPPLTLPHFPPLPPWAEAAGRWRDGLERQAPLAQQLLAFVHSKAAPPDPSAC